MEIRNDEPKIALNRRVPETEFEEPSLFENLLLAEDLSLIFTEDLEVVVHNG